MKKLITIGLCIATAAIAAVLAYRIGVKRGVQHAIEDSEHFVLDTEVHDDYDYDLYIYLDGESYLTTLFIG